eukprot:TRINITY_DN17616_c0_g1_i2.p2 TRINITY_DN17616_c0_g1~~TRINITY_DN17616_c0_g1_i2.p2  ORF type:complete len:177 (+),score=32.06 TRINITY_DN17616_c0_g1_i2:176-706(+)
MGGGGRGKGRGRGRGGGDGRGLGPRRTVGKSRQGSLAPYGAGRGRGGGLAKARGKGRAGYASKGAGKGVGRGRVDGHTLLLVEFQVGQSGRTYSEHKAVAGAMDQLCQMYEQVLKLQAGQGQTAKYNVDDLWEFVDDLPDIGCLVLDRQSGAYVPHSRAWIKETMLQHLKGQAAVG